MSAAFALSYRQATIAIQTIDGATINQLGGILRRESTSGDGTSVNRRHDTCRVIQIYNRIFAWHTSSTSTSRIYQFDGDAFSSDISSLSGLFVAGETITGGTSGATAVVVDNSITGDTFIIIKSITGTFSATETITGGTSGATATLDTVPAQGGTSGQEGEWFVAHNISVSLGSNLDHSGLVSGLANNAPIVYGLFVTGGQFRSLRYDPDTNTWTESGNLLAVSGSGGEFGRVGKINDSMIWRFEDISQSVINTVIYNPNTDTVSQQIQTGFNNFSEGNNGVGKSIIEWNGRIFTYSKVTGNGFGINLVELSGGTWTSIHQITGSTSAGFTEWQDVDVGGGIFIPDGNSLYLIVIADINGGGGGLGWCIIKYSYKSGVITCDNIEHSGIGTATDDYSVKMAQNVFPTGLALGIAAIPFAETQPRWKVLLDQETNGPDGERIYLMWHVPNPDAADADAYSWTIKEAISDQPGVKYTWNGTTTVSYTPTTATVVTAGDFIGLDGDEQLFYVTTTPSAGSITIENPNSLTIPSGTGITNIQVPLISIGNISGAGEYAFSDCVFGGGDRIYSKGELDIAITNISPVLGGQQISFKLFSVGGATSTDVSFYFGSDGFNLPDTQCTLASPSAGSLNGKVIEGLTADNGSTTYTVIWQTTSDGVLSGDTRVLVGEITV